MKLGQRIDEDEIYDPCDQLTFRTLKKFTSLSSSWLGFFWSNE